MSIVSNSHKCPWEFTLSLEEKEDCSDSKISKVLTTYMKNKASEAHVVLVSAMKIIVSLEPSTDDLKRMMNLITASYRKRMLSIPALTVMQKVIIEDQPFFSVQEIDEFVKIETIHNKLCLVAGLSRKVDSAGRLFQKIKNLEWKEQGALVSKWLYDPATAISLRKLKAVNLRNIGFTRVPEEIDLLINCKKIDLSCNNLIGKDCRFCRNLKRVSF